MTRRLLPRIAGGVLIALLLPAGVAWATPSADIVGLTSEGDQLRAVVEVADIEPGTEPDPGSVTMSVNGADVPAEATLAADQVQIDQVAILVLDTSRSMTGDKILDAKAAAVGFLDQVPDAVRVGLVTFDSQTRIRVAPTTDHRTVADTVQGLEVSTEGATTLYDAVILTSDQFGSADVGTAVVLSDGADRGSQSTVEEAARAAKRSGAVFDSVAFGGNGAQVAALNQISSATGGTVSDAANADQLAAVFDAAATDIANRYVVVGTLPADLTTGSATVEVSMSVGGVPVQDSATVPLASTGASGNPDQYAPTPVPPPSSLATFVQDNIWVALAGIFVALLILVFVATSAARSGDTAGGSRMRRSLAVYTMGSKGPAKERETTVLGDTQVARSAVEFAGRVVARRDLESVVGGRLEAAGVPLKAPEWLLIHIGIMVTSGLFFMFLFDFRVIPTLLGLLLGFVGPGLYLSTKESNRSKAFLAALPDTLQLIAGSLSAGYSMPQAIDTVVREGRPPISSEFNRALVETRLGVTVEDALDGIAVRMKSQDFAWVVMAIRIQREVGGNLAEVLTTVGDTLRERERLRRQVQVLSAEGRLSAWILGMLPVAFAAYLVFVRPDYLQPLIETFVGWVLIGCGVLLLVIGSLWLRKVVKVEV